MEVAYKDDYVTLFHGNFVEWEKTEPIDLILADPPYPKEFKHLYDALIDFASHNLWVGGSLVTIAPHYLLPYIFNIQNERMKYRWMLCMQQESGSHPRMLMGVEVCWKPVLWYTRGSYPQGMGFVRDLFYNEQPPSGKAKLHKWQQAESWAKWIIEKFSGPQDFICDPMAGSGTALKVARDLGKRAIGFEIGSDEVEVAAKRLRDTLK